MAIVSVTMPAVTCCSCVDRMAVHSHPQSLSMLKAFGFFLTDGILFASCWRLWSQSLSLPPCSHVNLVACRTPDNHQGMTKIWEIKLFFLGTFCPGRTDLCMKGNVLFFKLWFLTCFLGSELSTDGLALEEEYPVLQRRCRTSALTPWCICSAGLGAGENAAEVVPRAYLRDFPKSHQIESFSEKQG